MQAGAESTLAGAKERVVQGGPGQEMGSSDLIMPHGHCHQ